MPLFPPKRNASLPRRLALWCLLVVSLGLVALYWAGSSSAQNAPAPLPKFQTAFRTSDPDPAFRFIAYGDWGTGSPMQFRLAEQMAKRLEQEPYTDALLLGDNIYPDGNIEKHAQAYFYKPYKPLLDADVRFITALGNHDVLTTHADEQIEFFKMPGRYYKVERPHMDIFVIDTNKFAGSEVQQQWLDRSLRESDAGWKLVMGHHPIYTSGKHGSSRSLEKTLKPLLEKHGVQFYLAGHDHDYERFEPINGVQYIVSGGGGAWIRTFETPLPQSKVRHLKNHFLSFEVREGQVSMTVIDDTGNIIDRADWQKGQGTAAAERKAS